MKKTIVATACLLSALGVRAGGYLTNTNQCVAFLRNPARDAVIAIDGAYSNPAGIGFMTTGWHLGFNIQSAYQTRSMTSAFGSNSPFALGTVNGVKNPSDGTKYFEGKAKAPVIPSIDLARVGEKWFASFHFGITGGGGKCTFDDGLPSFESQVAMLPSLIGAVAPGSVTGYSMDTHVQGRQYYFGGQFNVGYKLTPDLNISIGGRVVYANCNYYGYVRNIGVDVATPAGTVNLPASTFFESQGMSDFAALVEDRELNCDQSGWGFTPIIGVDYKTGRWNLAARYELKTRLRLKNQSGVNTSGLSEYDDGKKIAADIPAILSLGAQYEILKGLRASAGFHYYFDQQASQYEHREDYLSGGGWEILAGMEYDIAKRWTVSAGWQTTNYGLGTDSRFISDLSFVTNSNSAGIGAAFRLKEKVKLNLAYFKTFYHHYRQAQSDYSGLKETFGTQLTAMSTQLQSAQQQLQSVIANPDLSEEYKAAASQRLKTVQTEIGAVGNIATAFSGYSTAGYNNFHRTNDVFGIGIEVDF